MSFRFPKYDPEHPEKPMLAVLRALTLDTLVVAHASGGQESASIYRICLRFPDSKQWIAVEQDAAPYGFDAIEMIQHPQAQNIVHLYGKLRHIAPMLRSSKEGVQRVLVRARELLEQAQAPRTTPAPPAP